MKNSSLKWNERLSRSFSHLLLDAPALDQKTPNSYKLLPCAELFMTDLLHEIGQARSSVDVQFFTYEGDRVGRPLAPSLITAAACGLKSRLIIDEFMNMQLNDHRIHVFCRDRQLQSSVRAEWRATHRLFDELSSMGVEVQLVNPLGFMRRRKNYRDHRKLVVIDGPDPRGIAYTGGFNPTEHNAKWNDFMVRMTGDMVPILQHDFDESWHGHKPRGIRPFSDGFVLADAVGRPSVIYPVVLQLIRHAKRRVLMEGAYLRGSAITDCLVEAAGRVQVDIIVPLNYNKKGHVPPKEFFERMERAGARMYRFKGTGGMTHAKAMLADDVGVFGSHNFNEKMSGKMGEVSIATDNPSLVSQLEAFINRDIKNSIKQSHVRI
jgi:cardiolipin synthase